MAAPRFMLERTGLLVVDMQEKLLPHMHDAPGVTRQVGRLIDGATALGLPTFVTEQYRKGLGVTIPELASKLSGARCNEEKLKFSACIEPVRAALEEARVSHVLVCGIESHVCVLQTCLELQERGYVVGLVVDAISSRRVADQQAAQARLTQAGVVPTTVESVLLELVREAGTDRFKRILPLIK